MLPFDPLSFLHGGLLVLTRTVSVAGFDKPVVARVNVMEVMAQVVAMLVYAIGCNFRPGLDAEVSGVTVGSPYSRSFCKPNCLIFYFFL